MGCCESSHEIKKGSQDHANPIVFHRKYAVRIGYSEIELNNLQRLIFIFRKSSEFLSLKDSLALLGLNKYIREYIVNSDWEIIISIKACSEFLKENYQSIHIKWLKENDINFHNFYDNLTLSKNLLKNPSGKHRFKHWKKEGEWRFSKKGTWKNKKRCFCTSFTWAKLTQEIEIENKTSNKILLVKCYITRRFDCDSTAKFTIMGYENSNWKTLFDTGAFPPTHTQVVKSPSCEWININPVTKINPGVTKISVILAGKSNKNWKGYYGPRFGYTDIRIIDY